MNRKPIGPTAHGALDDAFATLDTPAPALFGLTGPAKAICIGLAASQGVLNALTGPPLGIKKVVPLRTHGELETTFVPMILLLPLVTGALQQKNARINFASIFAIAAANSIFTGYNAYERTAPLAAGQRAVEWVESEVARCRSCMSERHGADDLRRAGWGTLFRR